MIKGLYNRWSSVHIAVRAVILVAVSVLLALLIELFFNIKTLSLDASDKGIRSIEPDALTTENITRDSDGALLCDGESAAITFNVDGYVDRIIVDYEKDGYFSQSISAEYINAYGEKETKEYDDRAPMWLKSSSHNIRQYVDNITLKLNNDDGSLKITGIRIDNRACFNFHRFMLFALGFTALCMVVLFRKTIASKVEIGFAIVAFSAGLSMIIAMPLVRVGFDEETHLRNSYLLSIGAQTANDAQVWDMLNTSDANHPLIYADTAEEYGRFLEYLNENCNYYGTEDEESYTVTPRHTSGISTFAYVFMSLAINIARAFKLGFGYIYIIARLANLLTYVTVMFFAIKILRKGKILMALIGLMPTAMFMASTVSYDPVVTSFVYLGMSYIINNIIYDDCKGRWWQFALAACAVGYGCLAKAVYAPLLIMGFFIPKSHFRDDKTRRIVKAGFAAAIILLVMTFVLPVLMGASGGDTRGGDTSNSGQLQMILSHPFAYAGLLIKSIWSKLVYYTIGTETLDMMCYMGAGNAIFAIDALLTFVVFTHSDGEKTMTVKAKAGVLISLFVTTALIWTALYLAYTPVGVADSISGVQGRYFIPLLFPLFMLFSFKGIKVNLRRDRYNCLVLAGIGAILFWEIYRQILTACSF